MLKIIIPFLFLIIINIGISKIVENKNSLINTQMILNNAKIELKKENYDKALIFLNEYRKSGSATKKDPLVSFFVIESIGRIYLKIKQDPDKAIAFFSEALNDKSLTDAEFDIIRAWLGRAIEWKKLGILPTNIKNPDKLFKLGKKFYKNGISSQKYSMDISASADFILSTNFLIPFTIYYDSDPKIGEALYMMGDIRRRSWHKNDYWTENYYLMEVIRRFPHSELASKAYNALFEDVHYGYTGSSGDHTPQSWNKLLNQFKELSSMKLNKSHKMNIME